MLIAVKKITDGTSVLVNLDHIKKVEEIEGGTLISFPEGEEVSCTMTMEAWGETSFAANLAAVHDRPSLAEDIAALHRIIKRLRWFDQGFGEDVLLRVLSILQQHERLTADLDAARAALRECVLQIEYLHDKFAVTGTGEAVLARAHAALARIEEMLK